MRDLAARAHGLERCRDNLRSSSPMHVIGRLDLEQFRVGEDDPQLIVQTMDQHTKLRGQRSRAGPDVCWERRSAHACVPAVGALSLSEDCELAAAGSRHSVSAKMRIDPPAVRTYSTLPAEIQL